MEPEIKPFFRSGLAWFILVIVAAVALALMFAANNGFFREFASNQPQTPPPSIVRPASLLVTIDFGGGKKRAFRSLDAAHMSAFAALSSSSVVGHFNLQTDEQGNVIEIGGVKANSDQIWKLYLNGTLESDVPGNIDLKAGDKVEFRYE